MAGLDLSTQRATQLARVLEDQQRALAAIRYGSRLRVGVAEVVLNPDSPLASSNFASGFAGSPGAVEATLEQLPAVWEDMGTWPATVLDTPSSVGELGALAEETGWVAMEESAVMLLTDRRRLVDGEPGRATQPVPEELEDSVVPLLADAFGYTEQVERALAPVVGHRLDDPRVLAVGAVEQGELTGAALGFVEGRLGHVADLGVAADRRGHGLGRAVASAAVWQCLQRGATIVWLACEAGGVVERFWQGLGFETAYESVTFQAR